MLNIQRGVTPSHGDEVGVGHGDARILHNDIITVSDSRAPFYTPSRARSSGKDGRAERGIRGWLWISTESRALALPHFMAVSEDLGWVLPILLCHQGVGCESPAPVVMLERDGWRAGPKRQRATEARNPWQRHATASA